MRGRLSKIGGMGVNLRRGFWRGRRLGYCKIVLFEKHEAAEKVGLTPTTLSDYTRAGRTDLVRGDDFIVKRWQKGPFQRRRLYFTDRGLRRLLAHDYRVYDQKRDPAAPSHQTSDRARVLENLKARLSTLTAARAKHAKLYGERYSPQEERLRLRSSIHDAVREYERQPCALPGCRCICHLHGVPQSDVVAELVGPRYVPPSRAIVGPAR